MWEVQLLLLSKGESGGKGAGHHLRKSDVPLSWMGWHLLPPLESVKVKVSVTQLCPTLLWPHGLWPTRPLCPWDFPGKNAGVDCHSPFCLTQGSNLSLLHCREILHCLRHQGSPGLSQILRVTWLVFSESGSGITVFFLGTFWCETVHDGGYYGAWQSWVVSCNDSLTKCNCFKSWKHRNNG